MGSTILLREIKKIYKVGPIFDDVVKSVDFVAEEGKKALICGEDRTSRAALMRILGLIEAPTAGEVYIDDSNMTDLSYEKMCAVRNMTFGYVSDLLPLIGSMKVINNVQLPLNIRGDMTREEVQARALESLEYVGAKDLANIFPARLGEEDVRRVCLARAIVGLPSVLWVDDIWLAQDQMEQKRFFESLFQICDEVGVTLVMSSERPLEGISFDSVVFIRNGKLAYH